MNSNKFKNLKLILTLIFSLLLILSSTVLLLGNEAVAASTKTEKNLERGQTVSYNLDGSGAKEKIKWSSREKGYATITVSIKINGKIVLTKSEEGFSAEISLIDINTKDKYKEFVIKWNEGDGYMPAMSIYQYRSGKLKSIYSYKNSYSSNKSYYLSLGTVKTDGKGTLYWPYGYIPNFGKNFSTTNMTETAYQLGDVKNIAFNLSNNKLKLKSTTSFTAKTAKLKIAKTMQVYKTANKKSTKLCKALKGSKVTVMSYKITGKNKGYIYIKTNTGKKGWIYVESGNGVVLKN